MSLLNFSSLVTDYFRENAHNETMIHTGDRLIQLEDGQIKSDLIITNTDQLPINEKEMSSIHTKRKKDVRKQ